MNFIRTINNNIKHDIWGNFLMCRQLGTMESCSYLARKSLALARAIFSHRTVVVNGREFYDTWN
ncbi:MAG: hypothetical protein V1816_20690 [Pseudomonadota bacterium]